MQTINLRENSDRVVDLDSTQAQALAALGASLASKTTWWGSDTRSGKQDVSDGPTRSVLKCQRVSGRRWRIRADDVVGALQLGDLQIVVEPKIPLNHFMYILSWSDYAPRLAPIPVNLAEGTSFWELIARWYVQALDLLLRQELIYDYRPATESLETVRGRVGVLPTTRHYYAGRPLVYCEFEEFDADNQLNRVLKEAAMMVAGSSVLSWDLRRVAHNQASSFPLLSAYSQNDLHEATVELRSGYYEQPLALAAHILKSVFRLINPGSAVSWSFLIRTPELIESGLRNLLAERLADSHSITNKGRRLKGNPDITINPDLVFDGGTAIADVKYKFTGKDWSRSDLYQVISFATGFHSDKAALLDFAYEHRPEARSINVEGLVVSELTWPATGDMLAEDASDEFCSRLAAWLEESTAMSDRARI